MRRLLAALPALLALGAALAQEPPPAAPSAAEQLKRVCAGVSMAPVDGREMARRAECVLAGNIPSIDRIDEARAYAKAAMARGEPAGGLMLYLAFQQDPAYQVVRDGKVDAEAYRRLASRSLEERKDQVEAIEGLGFAAGKGEPRAGLLLAAYFHETLAPGNVRRLGALVMLLKRGGPHPLLEKLAREADAIERSAVATKASPRAFLQTYRDAIAAAAAGHAQQAQGRTCENARLKSVTAGEIEGAEFLPLTGTLVADTFLVKGHWSEFWTFDACGEEVPVKVSFAADGWGGATSRAEYNKGS